MTEKLFLGNPLVELHILSEAEFENALKIKNATGKKINAIIVGLHYFTEEELANKYSLATGIVRIKLPECKVPHEVMSLISEEFARHNNAVPIELVDNQTIIVAVSDPFDKNIIHEIKKMTNRKVIVKLSTSKEINDLINKFYGNKAVETLASALGKEFVEVNERFRRSEIDISGEILKEGSEASQLIKLFIQQAVTMLASDIHIEPQKDNLRIRFRIDGHLKDIFSIDKNLLSHFCVTIKLAAELDITDSRTPQDGHFSISIHQYKLDIRVSTFQTINGEKIVLRIFYQSGRLFLKHDLGFLKEDLKVVDYLLKNKNGVILVTGPTGSGKTTTLASCIMELNQPNVNVITIEDPVEYVIDGINQININPKSGITFDVATKHILRHDPDIIMVGEIRDTETARIALSAAITGHLVLSTLHTNDAFSTITRLLDMNVESYLIADALKGIISQRLVRRVCSSCKESITIEKNFSEILGISQGSKIFRGKGCNVCNETGYFGRVVVYEILMMDDDVKKYISKQNTTEEIKKFLVEKGMKTMWQNAIENVLIGTTTPEEIISTIYSSVSYF